MKIAIKRTGANDAALFVKIIAKNKDALGVDRPVAFVLPGGPGADHTIYEKYVYLQDVVDLVFHDPRGCGESTTSVSSDYTMENYIEDVEAIRKSLSLEKFIVLGKSYGAMCALGFALRYPHSVNKLILSAGAPSFRFLETAKQTMKRIGTPEQIKISEKLWAGSFKNREEVSEYFHLTNTLYSVKARDQKIESNLTKKGQHFSYQVLNEGFRQTFWHFDFENELHRVASPTLILAGREDWVTHPKFSEYMATRIPHSQLRVFENASHAMEVDVTEDYFQTIREFLKG